MKTSILTVEVPVARSERHPEFEFRNPTPRDLAILTWADTQPNVWRLVLGKTRSVPYALGSSTFMGCHQRDMSEKGVLGRLHGLYRDWETEFYQNPDGGIESIFAWRARFSIEHCQKKGFQGGFFQQFDGTYKRGCIDLDFTPDTLVFAVNRFRAWCKDYPTVRVTLRQGKTERTVWENPMSPENGAIAIGPGYEVRPWTSEDGDGAVLSGEVYSKPDDDPDFEITSDEVKQEESEP